MSDAPEPIAVVGIGCRLPGAPNGPDDFWRLLHDGVDAVTEVPITRWDADALYHRNPATAGKMNTRWGGFLDDLDRFDSDFFSVAPVEAAAMDPQQRILLEVTYEALQDAGVPATDVAGEGTGVYIGASSFDHGARQMVDTSLIGPYTGTGSVLSIIANRISYAFDLRGPSMVIDTACSSSLAAVHFACQALRSGEITTALAGGVAALLNPNITMGFSKGGFMAADGRCKAFDHRADGYVRSEGAGLVVLRKLSDALAAGDRVYAVVRGGAIQQDGRSNGIFAPNRLAQQELLRSAIRNAEVDPTDVDYIEAHGTGTSLGDVIEVGALSTVLANGRDTSRALRIGSVKSNLGHLEAAAGIAGFIKTVLCIHNRTLVPSLHVERPNPMLKLERTPIEIQTDVEHWPSDGDSLPLAGVSSFGFGGTIAHLILSGHDAGVKNDDRIEADMSGLPQIIPLSAKTEDALVETARRWAESIEGSDEPSGLDRVASTAVHRRDHHEIRAAVVTDSSAVLADALRDIGDRKRHSAATAVCRVIRGNPQATFVFPGQGGQWLGMGRRLAHVSPVFRSVLRECDAALEPFLGLSLLDESNGLRFDTAETAQPAIFACQVALAAMWRHHGVEPVAVVGHSLGEVAAAHVAGALSLPDAARVIAVRSRLLATLEGTGGMLMTELDAETAERIIAGEEGRLSIAAVNGERSTVLAGCLDALARIERELDRREVFHRRVSVGFAAHSSHVDPLQPMLRDELGAIQPMASHVPFHSTVTTEICAGSQLDADYWADNLRRTVRFRQVVERLRREVSPVFVEISPHPVLGRTLSESMPEDTVVVSSCRRDEDEYATWLRGMADLHSVGVAVNFPTPRHEPVSLPSYPWQTRRYPLLVTETGRLHGTRDSAVILGHSTRPPERPDWRVYPVRLDGAAYLSDHKVDDIVLAPAALWMSVYAEAAHNGADTVIIGQFDVVDPLALSTSATDVDVQLVAADSTDAGRSMTVESHGDSHGRRVHASALVRTVPNVDLGRIDLASLGSAMTPVDVAAYYDDIRSSGVDYGPAFQGLVELAGGDREALARFALPENAVGHADTLVHPVILDACLQAIGAGLPARLRRGHLPLPIAVDRLHVSPDPIGHSGWCHVVVRHIGFPDADGSVIVRVDVDCADDTGAVRWSAEGVAVRLSPGAHIKRDLLTVAWSPYSPSPGLERRRLVLHDGEDGSEGLMAVVGPTAIWCNTLDENLEKRMETWSNPDDVPEEVVCAWGLTPTTKNSSSHQGQGIAARLLDLIRTITAMSSPPRLTIVTRGGLGTEDGVSAGAALWGLGRCVANEHPELRTTLIDVDGPLSSLRDRLVSVLLDPDPPGQVKVDATGCFTPGLTPAPVAATAHIPIDPERRYLISGGFGSLGRTVSQWLVDRGARHLVLVGRNGPSPMAADDITRWRSQGVDVEAVHLDVADADAVHELVSRVGRPPLAGVIHCAGVLADAAVVDTGDDHLARTFSGKVEGAWNLHRACSGLPLDLFVLFSSFAGTLGSPGQAAYAAANTMIDALAVHRRRRGEPAVSIAWGPWADEGLGAESGDLERLADLGVLPLGRAEGMRLFEAGLGSEQAQVSAVVIDAERFNGDDFGPAASLVTAGTGLSLQRARPTRDDGSADLRTRLRRLVAEVLGAGVDQVPMTAVFADLGFDSLMVMTLRRKVEIEFGVGISAAVVWSYPTIDELAAELARRREKAVIPPQQTGVVESEQESADAPVTETGAISDEDLIAALSAQVSNMKGKRK